MIRTSSLTFSYSCRTTWWILAARGSAAVRSGWDNLLAEAMLESLIGPCCYGDGKSYGGSPSEMVES